MAIAGRATPDWRHTKWDITHEDLITGDYFPEEVYGQPRQDVHKFTVYFFTKRLFSITLIQDLTIHRVMTVLTVCLTRVAKLMCFTSYGMQKLRNKLVGKF